MVVDLAAPTLLLPGAQLVRVSYTTNNAWFTAIQDSNDYKNMKRSTRVGTQAALNIWR